jgi:hypothetical protein
VDGKTILELGVSLRDAELLQDPPSTPTVEIKLT